MWDVTRKNRVTLLYRSMSMTSLKSTDWYSDFVMTRELALHLQGVSRFLVGCLRYPTMFLFEVTWVNDLLTTLGTWAHSTTFGFALIALLHILVMVHQLDSTSWDRNSNRPYS